MAQPLPHHGGVHHEQQPPQQHAWLQVALRQLHTAADTAQRHAAEQQLLQWRRSPDAWLQSLELLQQGALSAAGPDDLQLLLFAAQTLRCKVAAEGAACLTPLQQEQLAAQLEQLMQGVHPAGAGDGRAAPVLPPVVVRQLCLALTSLAALLPSLGGTWLLTLLERLPASHGAALVSALAEEGAGDWRRVVLPGVTGARKLSMATTTRERFRCALADVLHILLTWLQQQAVAAAPPQQQQQQHGAGVQQLLETLAAVVRLGTLHRVSEQLAEQAALAGLSCVQSPQPDVVHASEALLCDLFEYAPEQLLARLRPHMLIVAGATINAAVAAATSSQPELMLMHAAAWSSVFAAFAEAHMLPGGLLTPGDADGAAATRSMSELRTALLQLAGLTQVHAGRLVARPCLHACAVLLGADAPAAPRSKAAAAAAAAAPGDAASEDDGGRDASSPRAPRLQAPQPAAAAALNGICQQLLLTSAACVIAFNGDPSASSRVDEETAAAAADAITDVLAAASAVMGPHQFIACVLCIWRGDPQEAADRWLLQQGTTAPPTPPLRLQQLQHAIATITATPAAQRLQLAVLMASTAQGVDAAADAAAPGSSPPVCDARLAAGVAELLSAAAAPGTLHHAPGMLLPFCRAVAVWANWLVAHLADSLNEASASLLPLVQLLLGVDIVGGPAAGAASTAVRAVLTAAAAHNLPVETAAPLLLQAAQSLPSRDAREQDLLASLALTLACAPQQQQQQQQQLRLALVQPAVDFLTGLLQQLQSSGAQWPAAATLADAQLSFHLARVRTALDALLMQQEQQEQGPADHERCNSEMAWAAAKALSLCRVSGSGGGNSGSIQVGQQHAANDPAIALVLQLLSLMYDLVQQHNGCGKLLLYYAKLSIRLLKLHPGLLLSHQQQQAFVDVLVAGATRPGGSSLCEPFAAALQLCCEQPAGASTQLQYTGPRLVQGFAQVWSQPAAAALAQPGAGDAQPDMAAALLRLSSVFARHAGQLQDALGHGSGSAAPQQLAAAMRSAVLPAAASCARCCHKRVGRAALGVLLDAILAVTTTSGGVTPHPHPQHQHQPFLESVAASMSVVAQGGLGALLVPAPLPRLHKAVAVLMELATLAAMLTDARRTAASSSSGINSQQTAQQLLQACLALATQRLACTLDTAALASVLAGGMSSSSSGSSRSDSSSSSSYAVARKLKRRLREFAEQHARSS